MWKWFPISAIVLAIGCRQDMHDQLKLEPLEFFRFFDDGRASRHPVDNTVARGQLMADDHLYLGMRQGEEGPEQVSTFPFQVTEEVLRRGRERFDVFCSPCHSRTGDGDGMIVQRGFAKPPSLHSDKLREATVGHLYDVIRRGFGAMPAYGNQVPVSDRWAIVAYLRALQLSRRARIEDVPDEERATLEAEP